jgi:type IV secretory pathway VirB2 component (pilin)
MKKLFPYILILVAIVGLLSPTVSIHAQSDTSTYKYLAPLGEEKFFDASSTDGNSKLGEYLNLMIKLFIGICSVLAVIMIVMGGIEYMTSELIHSKEHGKERITGAIFGLILALGAWTLLYTINPDLLNTDFGSLKGVTVEIAEDPILSDAGSPPGATSKCSKVVKTQINMFACEDIVAKVNSMLTAAKNAGLNITGGGYRTEQEQFALRTKFCGAGNELNPNAKCSRLVALPGESNHNNGKAFDLQCDGEPIQAQDNTCFIWLKQNAGGYGLYNLASEPWHWSVDGR